MARAEQDWLDRYNIRMRRTHDTPEHLNQLIWKVEEHVRWREPPDMLLGELDSDTPIRNNTFHHVHGVGFMI